MAALSVRIDTKAFGDAGGVPRRPILQHVAFEAAQGETVAITGPSGIGKTTLLNMVAGLEPLEAGRIATAPGTRIAYVFQEPRLLPWKSVADNLRLVLGDVPGREARIAAALAEVGLEESADLYASRLSLGMARRVSLARGFVVRPSLLLLDEPFVSLDEATADRLRRLLLDLLARHRVTALFVSHHLDEAVMLADRLLVLEGAPARVALDLPIDLGPAERRNPDAVAARRAALVRRHGLGRGAAA